MNEPKEKTIDEIFADCSLIDLALKQAVQEALLRHKQAGNPVVAWRDGKIVWIPPLTLRAIASASAILPILGGAIARCTLDAIAFSFKP